MLPDLYLKTLPLSENKLLCILWLRRVLTHYLCSLEKLPSFTIKKLIPTYDGSKFDILSLKTIFNKFLIIIWCILHHHAPGPFTLDSAKHPIMHNGLIISNLSQPDLPLPKYKVLECTYKLYTSTFWSYSFQEAAN